MAMKTAAKKAKRNEQVLMGAGLLLKRLRYSYGLQFGVGMTEQVDQCIRDIDQIERGILQRENAKAKGEQA